MCNFCRVLLNDTKTYCENCSDSSAPWRPHEDNIVAASELLGLSIPVKIVRNESCLVAGTYQGLSDNKHLVIVSKRLPVDVASQTLWHELTHASQNERENNFMSRYKSLRESGEYRELIWEQEAKANEDYHDTQFPLALANNRVTMLHAHGQKSFVVHSFNGKPVYDEHMVQGYRVNNRKRINHAKSVLGRV